MESRYIYMHAEAVDLGDWGLLLCHQNQHNIFEQMAAAMKLNHQDYTRGRWGWGDQKAAKGIEWNKKRPSQRFNQAN